MEYPQSDTFYEPYQSPECWKTTSLQTKALKLLQRITNGLLCKWFCSNTIHNNSGHWSRVVNEMSKPD